MWTADDGQAFELGLLSGPFIYWLEPPDRGQERATLKRAPVSARRPSCEALAPVESIAHDGNGTLGQRPIAIDGTQVVYIQAYSFFAPGVYALVPGAIRWRPCR